MGPDVWSPAGSDGGVLPSGTAYQLPAHGSDPARNCTDVDQQGGIDQIMQRAGQKALQEAETIPGGGLSEQSDHSDETGCRVDSGNCGSGYLYSACGFACGPG